MKKHLFKVIIAIVIILPNITKAQNFNYKNNRIACSADGNAQPDLEYTGTWNYADPDDWGATPAALAMLAKMNMKGKLVHYSYNNFMPSPPHTTTRNYMKEGVDGSILRWGYDKNIFFDVGTHKKEALNHLKKELQISTKEDPLYFVNMGPSEFLYQAVKLIMDEGKGDALSHVYIISHSNYNDNHLRRPNHHTIDQVIELSGNRLNFKRIKDQNNKNNPTEGWSSLHDWSVWEWLKNHKDPNIAWIWKMMKEHMEFRADISDAGMIYYLITGDEDGNPSKFETFLGDGIPSEYKSENQQKTNNELDSKLEEKLIIIEAEKFSLKGDWETIKDASASGGKYIVFNGSNLYKAPNHDNTITYNFKIDSPGDYTVKWFMRQPLGERGTDKGNDAWIYLSDNTGFAEAISLEHYEKFYGRSTDDFVLNGTAEVHDLGHKWLTAKFNKPGKYSINISGRSSKLQIDRIIMFKGMTIEEVEKKANQTK